MYKLLIKISIETIYAEYKECLNEKASQDAMNIVGKVQRDLESMEVVLNMLANASRKFGMI
jgi:hypothetical protein